MYEDVVRMGAARHRERLVPDRRRRLIAEARCLAEPPKGMGVAARLSRLWSRREHATRCVEEAGTWNTALTYR